LDDVKSVASTIQKIDNIDLYRQILNLQSEIMQVVQENNELKAQLATLRQKFAIREQLVFDRNAYWLRADGSRMDGPFCSNCWDVRQNTVRMYVDKDTGYGQCPTCRVLVPIDAEGTGPVYVSGPDLG
jgi:hypothetical protein